VYPRELVALPLRVSSRLDVDSERVEQIRADIQRHRVACGCELGSVFAAVAAVGFVAYLVTGRDDWSAWSALGRGVGWVVALSVVGKLLGLAYAQLRLIQLRSELGRQLGVRTRGPRDPASQQVVTYVSHPEFPST
jgi:hypothetical protein